MKPFVFVACFSAIAMTNVSSADFVEWKPADGGNGHKYMVVQDLTSGWNSARTAAHSLGGDLVTITSPGEQAFVESILITGAFRTGFYWLGLYERPAHEGEYRWVTTEPLEYTNWESGEPNNFLGLENRGTMLWSQSASDWTFFRRGHWNDAGESVIYNTDGFPDLARAGYVVEVLPAPATSFALLGVALTFARSRTRSRC